MEKSKSGNSKKEKGKRGLEANGGFIACIYVTKRDRKTIRKE